MKKIRTHTKGDAISPPLTTKQGPLSAPEGINHVHYELSPFTKKPDIHGTFDMPTKKKIDRIQEREAKK